MRNPKIQVRDERVNRGSKTEASRQNARGFWEGGGSSPLSAQGEFEESRRRQSAGAIQTLSRICRVLVLSLATCLSAQGQSYSVDWHTIDGGGGTSTGGLYTVSGTIGQPDTGTMSGGNYTLQGGFWGIIAAVQTPGAPWLSLACSNGVVIVSWPKPADGWILEYRTDLTSGTWTPVPPPYSTNATDCGVAESAPSGNRFYRLHKP